MDILHAEKERALLQERKNVALSACFEEERKLERIKDEIHVQERMKKTHAQTLYELQVKIASYESTISSLQKDIVQLQSSKTAHVEKSEQVLSALQDEIQQLEAQKTGLTLDITALQRSLNELAREKGEKQQLVEEKEQELRIMLASVEEETEKRNSIVATTVVEQTQLAHERAVLQKTAEELQREKKELYQLRTDLAIVRDRYAEFARTNKLPFNI